MNQKPSNKSFNKILHNAKNVKKDDFYTQLTDIEKELNKYKKYFKNKIVYCNCDDPRISKFFHYFSYNFEHLGLKKLITTCYKNNEINLFSQNDSEKAIYLEYDGDKNNNKIPDLEEIGVKYLKGDGDFRSDECIELLKEADIVVTNPPFSLFRPYVSQLMEYKKKFVIIGHVNGITYKETFKFIKEKKMWLGHSIKSGDREFQVHDSYKLSSKSQRVVDGKKYVRVPGIRWFTNLDYKERYENLDLYKKYSPKEYLKYDNYDAINVDKTKDIPEDYDGVMGVPITFMDKYKPDQFDILGITSGRDEFEARPTKRYINPIQVNEDGSKTNGSKANTRATLRWNKKPKGTYYIADNVKGYLQILYARILIKHKKKVKK